MKNTQGASLVFHEKAAALGAAKIHLCIGAPGNCRVAVSYRDQAAVVAQQAPLLCQLRLYGSVGLLGRGIGAALRIPGTAVVSPEHGKPPVGIGIGGTSDALHADLLTVVQERRAAAQQIEIGGHLGKVVRQHQIPGRAIHVVVGKEADHHAVGVRLRNLVLKSAHVAREPVDVLILGSGGNNALGLGGGEIEAVHGRIVGKDLRLAGPALAHKIDLRLHGSELVGVPLPERHASAGFSIVKILDGVKAESVHAQLQIVLCHVQHFLPDGGIVIVQLRHVRGEVALVIFVRRSGNLFAGDPGRKRLAGVPAVVIVVGIVGIGVGVGLAEGLKPFVVPGSVVDDKIENHLHVPGMAGVEKRPEIVLGAEVRVDPVVIRCVVFVIGGAGKNRCQPQPLYPETGIRQEIPVVQIVQVLENSVQVSHSVPVGVGKGADKNLIEHPVVVVRFVGLRGHGLRRRGRAAPCQHQGQQKRRGAKKNFFHV